MGRGQQQGGQQRQMRPTRGGIYEYQSVAVINGETNNQYAEEDRQVQINNRHKREEQPETSVLPCFDGGSSCCCSHITTSITGAKPLIRLFIVMVVVVGSLVFFAAMDFIGVAQLPSSHAPDTAACPDLWVPPLASRIPPPPALSVLVLAADNRPTIPPGWNTKNESAIFDIDYVTWASMTHRLYSMYHGYEYYIWRGGALDRALSWSKLYAALHLIPHYDYIICVDSDAAFTDVTMSLPEFLHQHVSDMEPGSHTPVSIAFSLDGYAHMSGGCFINAGVFIIKNTPWTMLLLQAWWNGVEEPFNRTRALTMIPSPRSSTDRLHKYCFELVSRDLITEGRLSRLPNSKHEWPFEQMVLNARILCDKQFSSSVAVLPSRVLMHGKFITHKVGAVYEERIPVLRAAAIDAVFRLISKQPIPHKAWSTMNETR